MDFSISQFTSDTGIAEAKSSPLALVKNDYSNTEAGINYASTTEAANIFRHLPSNMYANIVSGYGRPEAFSRSCFPYAHVTPATTTNSDGMSFFPYVGAIQHHPSQLQREEEQQELEETEHLKPPCLSNPMHNEQNCYYPHDNQDYITENEQITSVEDPYKYETLNNFKDPDEDDEVLGPRLEEALPDWATGSAMITASSEAMVHSAEVSRTSTSQTYTTAAEHEGLLDCSNRSSASKTYEDAGGDYCSTDQSMNVSQSKQQHQVQGTDQSFQESSAVYMTQGLSLPSSQQVTYPQTAACSQPTVMPSMVPYQYISCGFTGSDQSNPQMEGSVSQNFVFNGPNTTASINTYSNEVANSQGLNSDPMENSLEKGLYSRK